MKTIFWLSFVTIFQILVSIAANADEYLCVADKETGFRFDKTIKSWVQASFNVDDNKYLIARPTKKEAMYSSKYLVKKIGESFPTAVCKNSFTKFGIINCSGLGGMFIFNKTNGRFVSDYLFGYYNTGLNEIIGKKKITDETSDTPAIQIGKCSPFGEDKGAK